MKRLLRLDWDVIAGIAAAVVAIVLHLLHVVDVGTLFTIVLVLLAMLLFRDLRREGDDERLSAKLNEVEGGVASILSTLEPPEAILVGPRNLRAESRRFCETACGDMVWFNVCFTMFRTQEVFDLLLRPAIENPLVKSIEFVSGHGERELWEQHMRPKIEKCKGKSKVTEPQWRDLPETISFILADFGPKRATEALLSFWGEPFMGRTAKSQAPRYVFRVQGHSDLVAQFVEIERQHRIGGP